jgi:hypothetical protein
MAATWPDPLRHALYNKTQFWDGRVLTLEDQAAQPIEVDIDDLVAFNAALRPTDAGVVLPRGCNPAAPSRPTEGKGETMNKKFFTAWIVLFVAWFIGSFVVHGVLLRSDYLQLTNLFRAEGDQQTFFPLMIVAHLMLSGAFVWIYARGVEAKPWIAQGLRFGAAVALLTIVPTYIIYFVVQPMPGAVVIKQIVFDGILTLILGSIVAWLYRGKAAAAA